MEARRGNDTPLKIGCQVECGGIPHSNWLNNPNLHHADKLLNNRKSGCHQSRLFAKAFPEWDFK